SSYASSRVRSWSSLLISFTMLRPITAQARDSPSRPIAGLREELALSLMDRIFCGATKRYFRATKRAPGVTSGRLQRDETSFSRHERPFSRDEAAFSGDNAPSR